jgi:hypothetical protein
MSSSLRSRVGSTVNAVNQWKDRRANLKKLAKADANFRASYDAYWKSSAVPATAQEELFLSTWASGGTFPRSLARAMAPAFDESKATVLNDDILAGLDPRAVASSIQENGYYVWDQLVAEDIVTSLKQYMDAGPADPSGDAVRDIPSGPPEPTAPTWWMKPRDIIGSETVQRLLCEQNLITAGARYLNADPVLVSMVMWTSFPWPTADDSSAQLFHYDLDRSNFIKMFIYLTDVDDSNGPHVYVPNSHMDKPKDLLGGERITDERLSVHYPADTWQTITGKKGTLFFADTQGFHKGAQVHEGSRSILQFNMASDRFGYEPFPSFGDTSAIPTSLQSLNGAFPRFLSQMYTPVQLLP